MNNFYNQNDLFSIRGLIRSYKAFCVINCIDKINDFNRFINPNNLPESIRSK